MARQMFLNHNPVTISHIGYGIASLLLCALALFVCASHSRRWKSCYGYRSQDPVIELNPEEILDYQFGDADPTARSGEGSLWRKNILMGGKCQLPDFSGVIIYDSTGNVVTPAQSRRAFPALPWR